MQYYAVSEKGTTRKTNEDTYLIEQKNDAVLFAIADGVGGLPKGKTASMTAIQTLQNIMHISEFFDLKEAIEQANHSVFLAAEKHQEKIATTLVACLVDQTTGKSSITHVGDSRAYIIDDTIWKTKDHTLVQELVDLGVITEQQALKHPERHRLNQALGLQNTIQVHIHKKLLKDSILVLCSDGLSDYLPDNELAAVARQYQPKDACFKLIEKARNNGSTDDITMIIAHIEN